MKYEITINAAAISATFEAVGNIGKLVDSLYDQFGVCSIVYRVLP